MTKMHEILAVEPDLVGTAKKIIEEGVKTFKDRKELFAGLRKTYQPLEEGGASYPPEITQVVETVPSKLQYVADAMVKSLNVVLTKEMNNTQTSATLEVDGIKFGEFPATVFLALEKQLKEFRRVVLSVPTLDPTHLWSADPDRNDIRITATIKTQRTEKTPTVIVKYAATKEHPAQTDLLMKDVVVGDWSTIKESGMISPKEKSELLTRIDLLIRAVKKARQRANDIEVKHVFLGKKLLEYVLNG